MEVAFGKNTIKKILLGLSRICCGSGHLSMRVREPVNFNTRISLEHKILKLLTDIVCAVCG